MKGKRKSQNDYIKWFEMNIHWLAYWLNNVVVIEDVYAKQSKAVFQIFREPIIEDTPNGIIKTNNILNAELLKHAVFGIHTKSLIIQSTNQVEGARFSGFLETMKRLPREKDTALFTATKWHEFGLYGDRKVLTCICSIDFFVSPTKPNYMNN